MRKILIVFAVLIFTAAGYGQKYHPEVQAVRDVIEKWDTAYRNMDAKAMAATIADEYELSKPFRPEVCAELARRIHKDMDVDVYKRL